MADLLSILASPKARYFPRARTSNFSGTMSYIERLPARRPLTLKHGLLGRTRDTFVISNAPLLLRRWREQYTRIGAAPSYRSYLSPSKISKFRLLSDGRSYHPLGDIRPLVSTSLGADRLKMVWQAPSQPEWERQADIIRRHAEKAKRQLTPGWSPFPKSDRSAILSFSVPKRLKICAERQIRREVLGAMGVIGSIGLRPPLMRPMSQIRC